MKIKRVIKSKIRNPGFNINFDLFDWTLGVIVSCLLQFVDLSWPLSLPLHEKHASRVMCCSCSLFTILYYDFQIFLPVCILSCAGKWRLKRLISISQNSFFLDAFLGANLGLLFLWKTEIMHAACFRTAPYCFLFFSI